MGDFCAFNLWSTGLKECLKENLKDIRKKHALLLEQQNSNLATLEAENFSAEIYSYTCWESES